MFDNLLDDPRLLAGLCEGTDEAYTALFDAIIGDLRRYFERWKFADADPADLAQITFVNLYLYDFKKYKAGSLAALVTTFARNVRVDQFRKAERRREASIDVCDLGELCNEVLLEPVPNDNEIDAAKKTVAEAMALLSEKHREILERSVLGAEPMKEIAKDVGISKKGAYARRDRALKALRNTIKTKIKRP